MAAKFFCCFPLRFGVFVISFFQFLFCGGFAAFFWWALWHDSKNDAVELAKTMKITLIVVASIYTLVALVGLIGFIGAILRKNQFIKTFFIMLCVGLVCQLASGIWYMVTFFTTRNQSLADCLGGTTDQTKIDYCNAIQVYKRYPPGLVVAQVFVPIVIQLYACYVVHQYSKLLRHQLDAEKRRQYPRGPTYQPVARNDEHYPLTQPNVSYPYRDTPHSFGSKA